MAGKSGAKLADLLKSKALDVDQVDSIRKYKHFKTFLRRRTPTRPGRFFIANRRVTSDETLRENKGK